MAATVAHEIRNPLGGIRGYASLLYRDLESNKHLQEMAGTIIEGTKTLEKLVSAVLHYSRPIQIDTQTIELGSYLKKIGKFLKVDPAFPDTVRLDVHIPNDPLIAPIDPEALKSALLNLVFNAFQAMPQGGSLTISLMKMDSLLPNRDFRYGSGNGRRTTERALLPFLYYKAEREMGSGLWKRKRSSRRMRARSMSARSQEKGRHLQLLYR